MNTESVAGISTREAVLKEATELTCGERNDAYGDPYVNHKHIAEIFNAVTGHSLSAREIALVHTCTKLARRAKNPTHHDSYVDGAAYTAIEYECALVEPLTDRPRVGLTQESNKL